MPQERRLVKAIERLVVQLAVIRVVTVDEFVLVSNVIVHHDWPTDVGPIVRVLIRRVVSPSLLATFLDLFEAFLHDQILVVDHLGELLVGVPLRVLLHVLLHRVDVGRLSYRRVIHPLLKLYRSKYYLLL